MSDKVEDTLAQLGVAFAVRDIMTRYEDLQLVEDEPEARRFFEEQEDYDYTASPKTSRITIYYKRGEPKGHPLRQEDLLSDGTGLLDLLDLLAARDFFFVLSANRICGFVHFSDLNDEPCASRRKRRSWSLIQWKVAVEKIRSTGLSSSRWRRSWRSTRTRNPIVSVKGIVGTQPFINPGFPTPTRS